MVAQFKKIKPLKVAALQLDLNNPRLALMRTSIGEGEISEGPLIAHLHEEADLQELVTSILENGFISVEPLIGIKIEGDKYKILEGNRRLASIKLIHNEDLRNEIGISLDSEKLTPSVLESMEEIPVYIVDEEIEAKALIGFKHIKGPYKWNSFAKARYVTVQYKDEGKSIENISKAIGDQNQTVRNLIGGMLVLDQAIDEGIYKISDRSKAGPFGFSHLYTALGRTEYKNFLGLESGWDKEPGLKPIPNDKLDKLKEVLIYLYGSKAEKKDSQIKSQNPDLKRLGESINNKEGLIQLRAGFGLDKAFEETKDDDEVFENILRKALIAVDNAQSVVTKYDGKDDNAPSIAAKILRGAKNIEQNIRRQNEEYNSEAEKP